MALIEARRLRRVYRMGPVEVRALDGVDFAVEKVGRSGSGKMTLLNLLGGLDRPTEGQVFLDGQETSRLKSGRLAALRRDRLGFIFQEYNLIPVLTALENVELPLKYAHLPLRERRQRARQALERVGLGGRLHHRATQLSGGEQQRVAIARALVNGPAVVLADEPTGEVDSHTAAQIIEMVLELNETTGQTFIVVTHDMAIAERAKRIVRLQDGRIASDERLRPLHDS